MTTIGIFVFDGAEELDWVGPWEVLASWARIWPEDGVDVFTMSLDGEPVTCAKGLRVIPDRAVFDAPPIDVLVYPGGRGTRDHLGDVRIRSWLHAERDRGTLLTSVCTGALVFADAGLLDGRPATTYWSALDLMPASARTSRSGPTTGSSTPARSSPPPVSRRASTWLCTWFVACIRPSGRSRFAVRSNTTPSLRCDRDGPSALSNPGAAPHDVCHSRCGGSGCTRTAAHRLIGCDRRTTSGSRLEASGNLVGFRFRGRGGRSIGSGVSCYAIGWRRDPHQTETDPLAGVFLLRNRRGPAPAGP